MNFVEKKVFNSIEELKKFLEKELLNCTIAVHGIDYSGIGYNYVSVDENGNQIVNIQDVEKKKLSIMKNGLYYCRGRSLSSTMKFGINCLEMYMKKGCYDLGGVIITLPVYLKGRKGEIFLGTPLEENIKDRNHSYNTICEKILPDYDGSSGKNNLDSCFVLASYDKLFDGRILLTFNPNNIYFNNEYVSDEFFLRKMRQKKIYTLNYIKSFFNSEIGSIESIIEKSSSDSYKKK